MSFRGLLDDIQKGISDTIGKAVDNAGDDLTKKAVKNIANDEKSLDKIIDKAKEGLGIDKLAEQAAKDAEEAAKAAAKEHADALTSAMKPYLVGGSVLALAVGGAVIWKMTR